MSDYRTFCDHYGSDYDTEAERRAAYQLHEQNRAELSAIFFPEAPA